MKHIKENYYRIGEVSKITGISKDTLHFYDKIGLLKPDYIDEDNQYRYYSIANLWHLDIITICRKLSIPLEQVREVLKTNDNDKITQLLSEYRTEALKLSRYYQKVADDISWYQRENYRITVQNDVSEVQLMHLEAETVIAGALKRDTSSYYANLLEASKEALINSDTIRRKYGYVIDVDQARQGKFVKWRGYLKMPEEFYVYVKPENLIVLPEGDYAVYVNHISEKDADFSVLFRWLEENGYTTDAVYAEEIGLQLSDYYTEEYYCKIKAHLQKKNP